MRSESIAAIISHIRQTFGKKASIIKPDQVLAVRAKIADRKTSYKVDEIKAVPENE